MLKGLLHCMITRFLRLSSSESRVRVDIKRHLERLAARGYSPTTLNGVMPAAYQNILNKPPGNLSENQKQLLDQIYLTVKIRNSYWIKYVCIYLIIHLILNLLIFNISIDQFYKILLARYLFR